MSAFQTDPRITLQGLQQPESLGDMVSRFAQLRALSQNMQSQRLRDEETNLRLTELRRLSGEEAAAKQDRDLLQEIWMEKGGDEEATLAEAVKRGVRMETVNTLKTEHAKRMTELIKLDDAQRDRLRKRNQDISAAIFPLTQIPETPEGDAQLVQLATQTLQGLAQQGLLSAEEAQQYAPILQQPPAEIRKTLGFLAMAGISADKQYEAATQAAKRNELTASEKDFQAFYKPWLEANNLQKNAKNELAAREAFREQKRTPVPGVDVPLSRDVLKQRKEIAAAGRSTGGTDLGASDAAVDPTSQSILAQTGLSYPAFAVLTGQASQLPRDAATRRAAMAEASAWSRKKGVDVATLSSQFKAQNEVLAKNIWRLNNTQIMEQEILGTVQNLQGLVDPKDAALRIGQVLKIWAGQEVNDEKAQQYAFHLGQVRNELAAYFAAAQGRTGGDITLQDKHEAETAIKNGIAAGSLKGLATAVENSTAKMKPIMEGSVARARNAVWKLFGVTPPGAKLGTGGQPQAASAPAGAPPTQRPAVGTVEDGYRFKGGNPADPKNWEKVQ